MTTLGQKEMRRLVAATRVPQVMRRVVARPDLETFVSSKPVSRSGPMSELFAQHQGRQVTKWSQYFDIYDQVLSPYRAGFPGAPGGATRPLRFLELGVFQGGSLELWREFFGADAAIMGIDIDERCAGVARADLPVRIGSQADGAFLKSVVNELGGVDVVLDDGSHVAKHQRASFDALFPLLTPGGLYIVEDVHTSYWADFGGGFRRPGAFIEVAKGLVDGMHSWYHRGPLGTRSKMARDLVRSVTFFDSVVVIEKARRTRPQLLDTGTPSF